MEMAEILEGIMITSFSISWYWSIVKMLKTKKVSGKSFGFAVVICVGYLFGVTSKIAGWIDTGVLSKLIYLYAYNLMIVAYDAYLTLRFSRDPAVGSRGIATADSGAGYGAKE